MTDFDYGTLEHRLRELAFLNSGAEIVLVDARHADEKREVMHYEGGLAAYVRFLDRSRNGLISAWPCAASPRPPRSRDHRDAW